MNNEEEKMKRRVVAHLLARHAQRLEEGNSLQELDHHVLAQIEQVDAHLPNWDKAAGRVSCEL